MKNYLKTFIGSLLLATSFVASPLLAADYPTIAVALRYLDASSTSVAGLADSSRIVSKFWTENTKGVHTFTVTVHPTVLLINKNKPVSTYCSYTFMGDAYNAIVAAGIDLTKYKRAIIVLPMQTVCPYKGFQSSLTSGIPASFTSSTNTQYIAHELGHSIGLGHANSITCKSPLGIMEPLNLTKCTKFEYGGAYDVMGKNLVGSNSVHRAKLGLMTPFVHTTGEATYSLTPVGLDPTAQNALKVVLPNNRALWIEYRQQVGADSRINWSSTQGALVWAVGTFGGNAWCGDYAPCQVDMDQTSGASALKVGVTYTNEALGVTLLVTDMSPEKLTITVKN